VTTGIIETGLLFLGGCVFSGNYVEICEDMLERLEIFVGVRGICDNNVKFCDDRLERLVCCSWGCVGLVVMMWSFVRTYLRALSVVGSNVWD